jgi:hypothetical protein
MLLARHLAENLSLPVGTLALQGRYLGPPPVDMTQAPRMLPCITVALFIAGLAQGMRKLIHTGCSPGHLAGPQPCLPADT